MSSSVSLSVLLLLAAYFSLYIVCTSQCLQPMSLNQLKSEPLYKVVHRNGRIHFNGRIPFRFSPTNMFLFCVYLSIMWHSFFFFFSPFHVQTFMTPVDCNVSNLCSQNTVKTQRVSPFWIHVHHNFSSEGNLSRNYNQAKRSIQTLTSTHT